MLILPQSDTPSPSRFCPCFFGLSANGLIRFCSVDYALAIGISAHCFAAKVRRSKPRHPAQRPVGKFAERPRKWTILRVAQRGLDLAEVLGEVGIGVDVELAAYEATGVGDRFFGTVDDFGDFAGSESQPDEVAELEFGGRKVGVKG